LYAGTSGWAYPTWKPGFYPEDVSAKNFLRFYASRLNSVEVNYTFTKLPTPAIVAEWLAQTGEGFRFSFKAPQRITHFNRLLNAEPHLEEFLRAIGPVAEAGKLGLILFQLPPNFKANHARLRDFLTLVRGRTEAMPPIAFEFRHVTWFDGDDTASLLREHNAAFCIAESESIETPEIHCAQGHTSFRLRRPGGYKAAEILAFAERFTALAGNRDVYVYFKHEDAPKGALNATALLRKGNALSRASGPVAV
jgi:uncharacterized protein YecE (DUF72 family)